MVVAGLIIGNLARRHAMSTHTRENLDNFWELLDDILNAVLFVLIGMELLLLPFSAQYLLLALCVTPLILATRLAAVGPPVLLLRRLGHSLPAGSASSPGAGCAVAFPWHWCWHCHPVTSAACC
ncbi:hypothetical protein B597_006010 [Stutzerimonas stutzeri KOS6]|uniref:Cation/H+ exchanger transmembrane domain-containing protein n=1 Tax=Stutzerimonas stutzeri KOS6 TaxID=1218352 RepID=A0A061JR13_STUST|nr:hypothetical protein B597_006010 [Stutzerimonas stutzeri KOS6]